MTTPDAPRDVWVAPKLGAAWATGVLHAMRTSCEVMGRTHVARYVRADLASVPSGDTEPVAWALPEDAPWDRTVTANPSVVDMWRRSGNVEITPLYAHPAPSGDVEGLRARAEGLEQSLAWGRGRWQAAEAKVAELEKALRWYADPDNYIEGVPGEVDAPAERGGRDWWAPDNGDIARVALADINREGETDG